MGSLRFAGVRFVVYPNDHEPPHVHGHCDGGVVIVDLLESGNVALSERKDAVRNTKASTIRKVLKRADAQYAELIELWEKFHGSPDKQEGN